MKKKTLILIILSSILAILTISLSVFFIFFNNTEELETTDMTTTPSYILTATGQAKCYDTSEEIQCPEIVDSFYGQDANYLSGQTMSFTKNEDGTVVDNNTGLIWQEIPSSDEYSWQESIDYVNDLELGGYDDWRVPTVKELYSIADFSKGWPYLDTNYFSLASGEITKDEQFWSSNYYVGITVEGQDDAAFGVNAVTGHIKAYAAGGNMEEMGEMPEMEMPTEETSNTENTPPPPTTSADGTMDNPMKKYVRAVRGNDSYGVNDFVDNEDGTVTDEATELMWLQADNGETMDWENALEYAKTSEYAGYTDWRLPNVKELQSIVDYSKSPSATEEENIGAAIDEIFTCTPTINEAGNDDYGYYWTNTSAQFRNGEPYYYAWYVAFGMAVNAQGEDFHGAGAVRFDSKTEDGPDGADGERHSNYVRLVRDSSE